MSLCGDRIAHCLHRTPARETLAVLAEFNVLTTVCKTGSGQSLHPFVSIDV